VLIAQLFYVAPEVLQQKYTNKCDMWSVGAIVYVLLSGKVPFPGNKPADIVEAIRKGSFHYNHEPFKKVSDAAKDFINNLLALSPEKRPTAEEALKHPWFQMEKEGSVPLFEASEIKGLQSIVEKERQQRALVTYWASKLPEKNLEELRKIFQAMDPKGEGFVKTEEFVGALEKLSMQASGDEIKELVAVLDSNGSNMVNYDEFLYCCIRGHIYMQEHSLRAAFAEIDKA